MRSAQVLGLIALGNSRRRQAATDMNDRSSRSFADVVVTVECLDRSSEKCPEGMATKCAALRGRAPSLPCRRRRLPPRPRQRAHLTPARVRPCPHRSSLHLVDMAGSERQGQTHASGDRLRESGLINKTLSIIRRVVAGRSDPSVISPYNESVLTRLLKRTLSGEAQLLFLCCVSQTAANYQSTKGTVEFAMQCKKLSAQPTVRYLPARSLTEAALGVQRLAELSARRAADSAARAEVRAMAERLAAAERERDEAERRASRFENMLAAQITEQGGLGIAISGNLVAEFRRQVSRCFRELGVLINAFVSGTEREAEEAALVMDRWFILARRHHFYALESRFLRPSNTLSYSRLCVIPSSAVFPPPCVIFPVLLWPPSLTLPSSPPGHPTPQHRRSKSRRRCPTAPWSHPSPRRTSSLSSGRSCR